MSKYLKASLGCLAVAAICRLTLLHGNDLTAWLSIILMLVIARWVLKNN